MAPLWLCIAHITYKIWTTDVLNQCLEQYLRAFVMHQPAKWSRYLLWAELCYNTTFHSAIKMTPFEAVFGKLPPTIPSYVSGSSSIEAADALLCDRDELLSILRTNLFQAQARMKVQTDKHRSDKVLEVGQWCYVKLQPHKQSSLANHKFTKLRKRFYGPFKIIKRVGVVAYKLELPGEIKIHPVFHISVLKFCPNPELVHSLPLPSTVIENHPLLTPLAVLDYRKGRIQNSWSLQVLLQWSGLPLEDTSWEDLASFQQLYPDFHLEDKVSFGGKAMIRYWKRVEVINKGQLERGEHQEN